MFYLTKRVLTYTLNTWSNYKNTMNYLETLKHSSQKFNSIVCLGMDPVLDKIPLEGDPGDVIFSFYEALLNRMVQTKIFPGAVKPNYAFYAQYGIGGIQSLFKLIELYKKEELPIILDVKRGDIGSTAKAYAKESFEFFGADAVTLSPYLGYDSIEPFIDGFPDKGYYILTKTSNASSGEIQDISYNGNPLFEYMSEMILKWYHPGIGSVVGATYPDQLNAISTIFLNSGKEVPLLIPGVGSQGGSLEEIIKILQNYPDLTIHRINSSSAINYAHLKKPGTDYAVAAIEALEELNVQIGL